MRSLHEPIIARKAGIAASKGICYHVIPVILRILQVMKNKDSVICVDILQQLGGHVDPPRRARCIDCSTRIVRIVDDYPSTEIIPYLKAHSFAF